MARVCLVDARGRALYRHELVLLTLSVSLTGGGITQTSLIVAGYVAALAAAALLAKPFLAHAATVFVAVEILLGVTGGLSAVTLYVAFSFYGTSAPVLVAATETNRLVIIVMSGLYGLLDIGQWSLFLLSRQLDRADDLVDGTCRWRPRQIRHSHQD